MQKMTRTLLIFLGISLTLLSGCQWWSKQSTWMTYIEQTMASQKNEKLTAKDKLGTPVSFEWVKVDPQAPNFSEKIKDLPEILGVAFAPFLTKFLSTYPETVSIVDDFKPFGPLFKMKGIENVDWKSVEEMIRASIINSFQKDILPPKNTLSWLIIAKDTATLSPLGFLQISVSADDLPENIYIKNIAFKPEAQHRGIGKLIFSSIFKLIPDTSCIYLRVLKTNTTALNAYDSYGFRRHIPQKNKFKVDGYEPYKIYLEYKADESDILQKAAETLK